MRSLVLFSVVITLSGMLNLVGQSNGNNRDKYNLHINKTDIEIEIDGVLDEAVWSKSDVAANFHRILPIDTGYAVSQTQVMMAYDEYNIYMGIICYDTLPGKRPVESLRRDFSFGNNDNFIAFIDTYDDRTNGFAFGVSAAGAQWDGIQANGGFVSLDWDCKWKSAVTNHPGYWIAEFSIPFRSIRFQEGDQTWGINFSRLDLKSNEKSSWAPVPRQFQSANLAYTGALEWDQHLPKAGVRASFIPYVSGKALHDSQSGEPWSKKIGAGLDSKIILSSSLNLDITVNPDFSQVESDRQRTNLDRFELFYPEKRQFFLENSDLFANLGAKNIRPFFSRRIGLNSPILAGGRLSGALGDKWRIGLMNVQTGSNESSPSNNFSVVAMQRKVFSRSNVVFFMTNKEVIGDARSLENNGAEFNRVAGLDFNLASSDNKVTGKAFYHQSFSPETDGLRFTTATNLAYNTQHFSSVWNHAFVAGDYLAEMGFVRRRGYHQLNPVLAYKFFPNSEHIVNHGLTFEMDFFTEPDLSLTDREIQLGYSVEWMNRSRLSLEVEDGYVKLLEPFDPTNTGGDSLAAGSEHNWKEISLQYSSDNRRLFKYSISSRYGGYFNGTRLNLNAEINYRVQPFGSLAIVASYYKIELPQPYESADFMLIGPRLDITFTNKLFFTTFVQYNNQIDNVNVNLRFQWRFAPASDLFIVYTNNSFPENFQSKNQGLVVKLSYWIN
jgi:hypothetical protein